MKNYYFFRTLLLAIVVAISANSYSQISFGGTPPSFDFQERNETLISAINVPIDFDVNALREEDKILETEKKPPRIAKIIPVSFTTDNSGEWTTLPDGQDIWRLNIIAKDALAIMLTYDKFEIPEGGKLFIYNDDRSRILGAYTEENNPQIIEFATEFILGDNITLEFVPPQINYYESPIIISGVVYGYNNLFFLKPYKDEQTGETRWESADWCEVNINCPEGTNWQDQKKGVVRFVIQIGAYMYTCSGSVVNNTSGDLDPLVLSAYHCFDGATTTNVNQSVYYFHYEYTTCAGTTMSPNYTTRTGATILVNIPMNGSSDGTLLRLTNNPNLTAIGVYFNGWDRRNIAATSGVSIHHPDGDVKKISTFTSPLVSAGSINFGSGNITAPNSAWRVQWAATQTNLGVTEGGSSGSPIFNQDKRIVGTLSGGSSYCDIPTNYDYYGKLWYHWDQMSNPSLQMKTYLDPINSGAQYIDGTYTAVSCFPITSFPYNEGFENNGTNFPTCWSEEYVAGTTSWTVVPSSTGTPATAHGGSYKARLFKDSYTTNKTKLIMPPMDLTAISSPTLNFWHTQQGWGPDQDILRIFYKTSVSGTWTLLEEYTGNVSSWTERTIPLPNASSYYFIAFEGEAKWGYGIQLDDISILSVPIVCNPATNLAVNINTTTQTASLNWDAPAVGDHPTMAKVRFLKELAYTNVLMMAICDVQGGSIVSWLAQHNFGASGEGYSPYYDLPPGIWTPVFEHPSGYAYGLDNPSTYNFQAGQKYTMVCSDDGQYLVFSITQDGTSLYNVYLDGAKIANEITGTSYQYSQPVTINQIHNWCVTVVCSASESGDVCYQTQPVYTISVSANPTVGGNPSQSGSGFYESGGSVSVNANPNPEYNFVNWTESGTEVSTNATYTFTASANRTLVANYTLKQYQVTYSTPENGTLSVTAGGSNVPSGTSVTHGTVLTINATPATNYHLGTLTVNGTNFTNGGNHTVIAATTIVCSFAENPKYNLVLNVNPTGAGTTTGAGQYYENQSVTITATPASNYNFINWTEGSTIISTNDSYTFSMPAVNKTYTANFALTQYQVTYSTPENGTLNVTAGGSNVPSGTFVDHGTVLTINATPATNYHLGTLTVNGTNFTNGGNHTVIAATTIVCSFAENPKYNLVLNVNPTGAGTTTGAGQYYENQSVTITATPASNYNFINWTEGSTIISTDASYTFSMPAADKTYTANFALMQYQVTYNTPENGILSVTAGGSNVPSGTFVDHGTVLTINATPATNYHLGTLTVNGTNFTNGGNHTVIAATDIVCSFVQDGQFNLVLNVNPTGAGTTTGAGQYYENQSVTITATPASNYNFINWTEGSTEISTNASYTFSMPAVNKTYTANFTLTQYQVTYSTPENGTLSVTAGGSNVPSGTFVDHGTVLTINATPATNYHLGTLTVNGTNFTNGGNHTVTMATDIVCSFVQDGQFNLVLNVNPTGAGTTTGAGQYYENQSVTITATPASNYNFINWTEGSTIISTDASYTFSMPAADKTYTANFALTQYQVTYNTPENGILSVTAGGSNVPSGTFVDHGTVLTINATPATNYHLGTLTVNGTNFTNGGNHIVIAATDIVCSFVQDGQFNLVLNVNPTGAGTTTGAGQYYENQSVTITATPASNYNFVNWTEGSTIISTDASYTFSMPAADKTYTANFALMQYQVTYNTPENGILSVTAGGSNVPSGTFVDHGTVLTINATPATNYHLGTLTVNGTNFTNGGNHTVVAATDIVCHFVEEGKYSITLSANPPEGGTYSGEGDYFEGEEITVNAYPAQYYNFLNWTESGTVVNENAAYTFFVNDNRHLTANFALYQYVVSCNNPQNGTLIVTANGNEIESGSSVEHGTEIVIVAIPDENYYLESLKVNGIDFISGDTHLVVSNTHIDCSFEWTDIKNNTTSDIIVYGKTNKVYIVNENNINLKSVEILDMLGRVIYHGSTKSSTIIELNVSTAYYVVKTVSDEGIVSNFKVHIKM